MFKCFTFHRWTILNTTFRYEVINKINKHLFWKVLKPSSNKKIFRWMNDEKIKSLARTGDAQITSIMTYNYGYIRVCHLRWYFWRLRGHLKNVNVHGLGWLGGRGGLEQVDRTDVAHSSNERHWCTDRDL